MKLRLRIMYLVQKPEPYELFNYGVQFGKPVLSITKSSIRFALFERQRHEDLGFVGKTTTLERFYGDDTTRSMAYLDRLLPYFIFSGTYITICSKTHKKLRIWRNTGK